MTLTPRAPRWLLLWVALAALNSRLYAAPLPPPPPTTTLHGILNIIKVRLDVAPAAVQLTEQVQVPKGAIRSAGSTREIFVSFLLNQRPLAFEASWKADGTDKAVAVASHDGVHRPKEAAMVLGDPLTIGHTLTLPGNEQGGMLELKTVLGLQSQAKKTSTVSTLVRLGAVGAAPFPLVKIEVAKALGMTIRGARARFCSPSEKSTPVDVSFPDFPETKSNYPSPLLLIRSTAADLCIDVQCHWPE